MRIVIAGNFEDYTPVCRISPERVALKGEFIEKLQALREREPIRAAGEITINIPGERGYRVLAPLKDNVFTLGPHIFRRRQ
ncbi:MAG: hypothetical protein WC637_00110 [Victivallales bacterium]|jgi:hypothetical protein